ncbi:MAG: MBL fold metallo-hydrolase [Bacteroidetes bacterium SW_4_67_19]|nr:MAG: MBL fold metallo-hydrolase [Bacteroidetes bacterium SW_4_67_19]
MPEIGRYTLHEIETGRFGLDGGAMFGIVPKPLWEQELPADERNRITLAARCLLLEGRDRLILIDNGVGAPLSEKFADIYALDREHSELHRSLEAAGHDAGDVTDVILTHLHFDHCGGTTHRDENGDWQLTFEHADHHVQRKHWEWARTSNPKEQASFRSENLDPLADSGTVEFVDGREEILHGIEALPIYGHTEAQQMVKISDDDDTLVFVADLLPTTHHLRAAWMMAYDVRPMRTIEEKADFLDKAERADWSLFFEHDPDTAVADLQRTEHGVELAHPRSLEQG